MFWRRKRKAEELAKKEALIQAINQDTLRKLDQVAQSTRELSKVFPDKKSIAELIFKATGAERRQ